METSAVLTGGRGVGRAFFDALREQRIETPSWAYGNSGTRFTVFPQEGVPRDPYEKIADAATVHRFTGVAPSVALHIPWDKVDDYAHLAAYAAEQGVQLGAINSNVFQDNDYKLGSVTNPDPRVRRKAVDHLLGRNYFGRSMVTGVGRFPPMRPHDRRSAGDKVVAPWPGYLIGGPQKGARDWSDEERRYEVNETAINWNGAMIYALAGFLPAPAH